MAATKKTQSRKTGTAGNKTQNKKQMKDSSAKSATSRKSSTKQTNQLKKNNSDISYGREITMLIVIAICILMLICCFGRSEDNLAWLKNGEYFLFGQMMYVMPFMIVYLFWLFLYWNVTGRTVIKIIGGILMFIGISGGFSLASVPEAGGLCGKGMYQLCFHSLGSAGLAVILLLMIVVGFVLLTEKSIMQLLNKGGKNAVTNVKKEVLVHKEQGAIRAEERARRRALEENAREEQRKLALEEARKRSEIDVQRYTKEQLLEQRRKQRMQHTEGICDTTISDEELPIMRDFSDSTISDISTNGSSVPEDSKKYTDDSWIFPKEGMEDQIPEIKLPEEIFGKESEDHASTPTSTSEDNHIKTFVTRSGKVVVAETDGIAGEQPIGAEVKPDTEKETVVIPNAYEEPKKEYVFPPMNLLSSGTPVGVSKTQMQKELKETALKLQQTLRNFGVGVTVTNISCGPSVTRYELQPEQGVKVSKIVSLTDDIKLNLAASDIRMEAPIPGKAAVGIEVPNKVNQTVALRDILESHEFKDSKSKLVFGTGRNIDGRVMVADIAKMPHLLIAGATGSGKSVCINTIVMSILYHAKPTEVKMIMVDPKVVELSVYNGIPHLLLPVVTDPKKAAGALNWAVAEMTNRYQSFAEFGVRDMHGYNEMIERDHPEEGGQPLKKMPQIVIIVDELADLMMVAPGEVEDAICRLAQMARAAGIHLIIATQRPSVNVITGLIKANVPSRIAFSVSSGVDSRTIIDMNGAEKLLGKGDMLYYPAGIPKPVRVQGAFVSDKEVAAVVEFLKNQGAVKGSSTGNHIDIESAVSNNATSGATSGSDSAYDEYFEDAGKFIIEKEKASIGMLQRMFKIGFNRAARIMDQLCEVGVVGEEEGTKPRKVLMTMDEFTTLLEQIK